MIKTLFNLLAVLPLWLLHAFGAVLGLMVYLCSADYRRKMLDHISVLYSEDSVERRRILRRSAMHMGMALMELPFLWGRSRARGILKVLKVEGWGHIDAALAQGKGVLFLTPHMGCFEGTAQAYSTRSPITVLYRPNRNPDVQKLIEESRSRDQMKLAPTSLKGVRILLRSLRSGEAIGMLPDQVPSSGEGVWAPMFGRNAYTMTLPGSLVKTTGCPVVIAVGIRRPFSGMTLKLLPGPKELSEDPLLCATQINEAMEQVITMYPEQYYWGYERYKPPKGKELVAP